MPTINKTKQGTGMYPKDAIISYAEFLKSLQGLEVISTGNDTSPSYELYFDGVKSSWFKIYQATNDIVVSMVKTGGESLASSQFKYPSGSSIWLREYVSVDNTKCRLINLGVGGIGENVTSGGSMSQTPICIFTGEDVNGSVIHGISTSTASAITKLYCPNTGIFSDLTTADADNNYDLPSHLSDSAYIVKAVNLCDPSLPEMNGVYNALFRPLIKNSNAGAAAPRYYISGSLWGCMGNSARLGKCNLFDPMVKI